jgi:hypothetical protein
MNPRAIPRTLAALALAGGLGAVALVASANPPAPPPEAFKACEGKARGDACTVQIDNHTLSGVCDAPPGESKLACRPEPPPPPPEAIKACEGKARGDACSVTFGDHTMSGVCDAPPGATQLACRPNEPPPAP